MDRYSRRAFLALGSALAVWMTWRSGPVRSEGVSDDAVPSELSASELDTLVAAVMTLLDVPADATRYREMLRWRSEKYIDDRRVYTELVGALDDASRRLEGTSFVGCPSGRRRPILERALGRRNGVPVPLARSGGPRDPDRFERYFVLEVIALFGRTDAWEALGYHDHPGQARGLQHYREPLS